LKGLYNHLLRPAETDTSDQQLRQQGKTAAPAVLWSASSVVPCAATPFKYTTRGRERSERGGVRTREMTCVRWGSSHSIKHLAVTL